jgi:1,4-dihydroxy-2-naphthoyl-CoA hydrolase
MESMEEHILKAKRTGNIEFFIEERKDDCVTSKMPVTEGILNPFGTVQAGAMLWMADVTATIMAIGENGKGFPLAVDLHTTLLGNQREGEIRAEARIVRRGKRIIVVRTRVTGDQGRLLAEVTTTHIPA